MSANVKLFFFAAGRGPEEATAAYAVSADARNLEGVNAAIVDVATNRS